MQAYEFYRLDPEKGSKIIGVLPERRKNPERITHKSIMNWGDEICGNEIDTKDIFFIQVTIDHGFEVSSQFTFVEEKEAKYDKK
jgi:hypothetical protein